MELRTWTGGGREVKGVSGKFRDTGRDSVREFPHQFEIETGAGSFLVLEGETSKIYIYICTDRPPCPPQLFESVAIVEYFSFGSFSKKDTVQ